MIHILYEDSKYVMLGEGEQYERFKVKTGVK